MPGFTGKVTQDYARFLVVIRELSAPPPIRALLQTAPGIALVFAAFEERAEIHLADPATALWSGRTLAGSIGVFIVFSALVAQDLRHWYGKDCPNPSSGHQRDPIFVPSLPTLSPPSGLRIVGVGDERAWPRSDLWRTGDCWSSALNAFLRILRDLGRRLRACTESTVLSEEPMEQRLRLKSHVNTIQAGQSTLACTETMCGTQ